MRHIAIFRLFCGFMRRCLPASLRPLRVGAPGRRPGPWAMSFGSHHAQPREHLAEQHRQRGAGPEHPASGRNAVSNAPRVASRPIRATISVSAGSRSALEHQQQQQRRSQHVAPATAAASATRPAIHNRLTGATTQIASTVAQVRCLRHEARQHLHDPTARRAAVAPEVDRRLSAGHTRACAVPVQPPPTVAAWRRPVASPDRRGAARAPRVLTRGDHRIPSRSTRSPPRGTQASAVGLGRGMVSPALCLSEFTVSARTHRFRQIPRPGTDDPQ
jgi:hypothetical protein